MDYIGTYKKDPFSSIRKTQLRLKTKEIKIAASQHKDNKTRSKTKTKKPRKELEAQNRTQDRMLFNLEVKAEDKLHRQGYIVMTNPPI